MTPPTLRPRSVWHAVVALGAASAVAHSCLQEVNNGASRGFDGASGGSGVTTRIIPSTDPIALDPMDEASTTMDACEKTRRDKTEILMAFCASCHAGDAAVGLPPWNFVLDDNRLISEVWAREGQPAQRFVIPGDPEHSALYQRMAIAGDMPPQPTDLGTHRNPTPAASDISVIKEWILHCLGAPSPVATGGTSGSGGTPGTGGATAPGGSTGGAGPMYGTGGAPSGSGGSAGVRGTGGTSGAAGATGAGTGGRAAGTGGTSVTDGGATDVPGSGGTSGGTADGGATSDAGTIKTCAAGVSNGDSCVAHTASCQAGSRTCQCVLSNGKHSWSCR